MAIDYVDYWQAQNNCTALKREFTAMAIWGSKKIEEACTVGDLISECNPVNISCCSYELSLGNEAYVTSFKNKSKRVYRDGEQIVIEPGQFGILLTKNKINLPSDVMGFISIKAGQKFRGLVNVSGFHVDPGFGGYLKFSVYNAGSQNINLTVGDPLFLIWFSEVIENEKTYSGNHAGRPQITSEDVMRIQGDVASPAALNERIKNLETRMTIATVIFLVFIAGIIVNVVSGYFVGRLNRTETNAQMLTEKEDIHHEAPLESVRTSRQRDTSAESVKTLPQLDTSGDSGRALPQQEAPVDSRNDGKDQTTTINRE